MDKKLSVLIVDDNENFVRRMVGLLEEVDGIENIHTATNYSDAVDMLVGSNHDIVLLDISLPGKSGIELLQKIKEQERDCKVIMISNFSANYYKQECKKLGATDFLDKTSEFDLVPAIITAFHLN